VVADATSSYGHQDRIEDVLDRWSVLMMKAERLGSAVVPLAGRLSTVRLGFSSPSKRGGLPPRNFSNHVLDKEITKPNRDGQGGTCRAPELSEWMNGLLSYSNEPTLSARLDELIDYVEPVRRLLAR